MSRLLKVIFSFCILFAPGFFSSCTVSMSKEEQAQNVLPAPSIETSIAKALGESSFTSGKWPEKNWWERYGSIELNLLIEKALRKNPTIQAVNERIDFAKSQAVIARSKLFPLITFNAGDEWQYLSENGLYRALNPDIGLSDQLIDFSFSFSYEFDFWGKYRSLYQAALGKAKTAIAETAQAKLITSTALAQAYFALRINLIRKQLYDELYDVRKHFFDLQTKMLGNALYSKLVPLLSEEGVFEAKQQVYSIEEEISVGKHLVNILTGEGPDEALELDEPLSPLEERLSIPSDISIELLARRPDLMAQIWRVDALALEVGAAKANFWPNINLTALIGLESVSWSKLLQWASRTVSIFPGLSLPIYTAGAIGANVDAKKALFNEAVYQYNNLLLQSFQQVADLLAIAQAVYKKKEEQQRIVANASERYALTQLRQQNGIDNALDTYQFLEELIQKELMNIELLYQQYLVSITLTKALGGGYLCTEEELK